MDGRSVSSPARGPRRAQRRKNPRGLVCKPRGGFWWVFGTLHAGGQSIRIRRSLGLSINRPEEDAQAERRRIEGEIIGQLVHGITPSRTFAEAAASYLTKPRARPLAPRTISIVKVLTLHFGHHALASVGPAEAAEFARKKLRGHKAQSVERYYTQLLAVLNYAVRLDWLAKSPRLERDIAARNPKPSQRKVKGWLTDSEVELVVSCAESHLRPALAVLATTGARVSEILYLPILAFILAKRRSKVRLENTKNGGHYWAPLHPWAARIVEKSLEGRANRDEPAFLTHRGTPYADTERKWGGQIKTGFRGACKRAAEIIAHNWAQPERAAMVRRATPHWLRHSLAMNLLMSGKDLLTVKQAGRWEDIRSVMHYTHEAPEHVREAIENRQFGTNLTHSNPYERKKRRSKTA